MKKIIFLLTIFISFITISRAQDFWEQTNGPYFGTMDGLCTDLDGVVFAGNDYNVYRSTNQGDNWIDKTSFPGISFAVNTNEEVFVGGATSIRKSTDDGITWLNAGTFSNTVRTIAIDSNDVLFAGTGDIDPGGGTAGGFFYSTNNGSNWNRIIIPDTGANSIVVHPNGIINIATLYHRLIRSTDFGNSWTFSNLSEVYKLAKDNLGALYAKSPNAVFRSFDAGLTWNQIFSSGYNLSKVVVDEEGTIFISKYSGGISYSSDYGTTWNEISVENNKVYNIAVDLDGTIYASLYGIGIYRSTDDGISWIQRVSGFKNLGVISIAKSPTGSIFAGTSYGGIWRSTDNGEFWTSNGFFYEVVHAIGINPNGYIYAGIEGMLYRSTNDGNDWLEMNLGITNPYVLSISINSSGHIFVGTSDHLYDYGNVFISTDNGVTWSNILSNIYPVWAISANDSKVFVGTYSTLDTTKIYRSFDNGLTWSVSYTCPLYHYVSSITIALNGAVYAGIPHEIYPYNGFGVIVSTDDGETWVQKNTGLTNLDVLSLTTNSLNHIIAGTKGGGTFLSTNNGDNWINISSGLDDQKVYALTVDNDGFAYAGTGDGVARSTNSTVIPVELISFTASVLQNEKAVELNWTTATEINNSGFEIERASLSATPGQGWEKIGFIPGFGTTTELKSYSIIDEDVTTGVYKYRLKQIDFDGSIEYSNEIEVEVDFTPKEFVLYQNYPNPFNPSTTIKFEIPNVETARRVVSTTLKVYDILGNEVATLVNEEKQPGVYEVEFNSHSDEGQNLSSGIYFYQLEAGNFSQIKKMVLLR